MDRCFRFERADSYSVDVHVTSTGIITYYNLKVPEGTPNEVIIQLYNDAEAATLIKLEENKEVKNGTAG